MDSTDSSRSGSELRTDFKKKYTNTYKTVDCFLTFKELYDNGMVENRTRTLGEYLLEQNAINTEDLCETEGFLKEFNAAPIHTGTDKVKLHKLLEEEYVSDTPEGTKEGDYEIDLVLNKRFECNQYTYRVLWKGYELNSMNQEWWLSVSDFADTNIITEYEQREEIITRLAGHMKKKYGPDFERLYPNYTKRKEFTEVDSKNFSEWSDYILCLRKFEKTLADIYDLQGEAELYVENWTTHRVLPCFEYINGYVLNDECRVYFENLSSVALRNDNIELSRCDCKDECGARKCCTSAYTHKSQLKTKNGSITGRINRGDFIVDCGILCSCQGKCSSSFVNKKRKVKLILFYDSPNKGWSILAAENLAPRTYIGRYVGEILPVSQIDEDNVSYLFDIVGHNDEQLNFCVDALKRGNETRFFNHSCDPNLVPINVYNAQNPIINHIVFLCNRKISFGEELTFTYTAGKNKGMNCLCSPNCPNFL